MTLEELDHVFFFVQRLRRNVGSLRTTIGGALSRSCLKLRYACLYLAPVPRLLVGEPEVIVKR